MCICYQLNKYNTTCSIRCDRRHSEMPEAKGMVSLMRITTVAVCRHWDIISFSSQIICSILNQNNSLRFVIQKIFPGTLFALVHTPWNVTGFYCCFCVFPGLVVFFCRVSCSLLHQVCLKNRLPTLPREI